MNDATLPFDTTPDFQSMLWYWARASEFTTPFLLAQELADDVEEQDELRPHLEDMIRLYNGHRARLLDFFTFDVFMGIHERIQAVRDRHATAWLATNFNINF